MPAKGAKLSEKQKKLLREVNLGRMPWNKGKPRTYKKSKIKIKCKYCGNNFLVIQSRGEGAKYCSFRCKQIGQAVGNRSRLGQHRSELEKAKQGRTTLGRPVTEAAKENR